MKGKWWLFTGMLFLLALFTVNSCKETKTPVVTVTSDTTRTFNMEYDHMWSYDVFNGVGQDRVKNAFEPANTNLNIAWSNWIDDATWDYMDLDSLINVYANKSFNPNLYDQKCYLLALGVVTNIPSNPNGELTLGETWYPGQEGKATSIIFVHRIRQEYPDYEKMVHKTTIHELGHARAWLTNLCLNNTTVDPNHDSDDCIMGQGRYAICTGWDLTLNLHFCNKCISNLARVTW